MESTCLEMLLLFAKLYSNVQVKEWYVQMSPAIDTTLALNTCSIFVFPCEMTKFSSLYPLLLYLITEKGQLSFFR